MSLIRGLSGISRGVNLIFKVTGLKEQSGAIQALTSGITNLIHLIMMANKAFRGLTMAMASNPLGWLLLGVTALSGILMLQGSGGPNEFEEYRSRAAK